MIQFTFDQPIAVDVAKIRILRSQIRTNDMGGWFDLASNFDQEELSQIKTAAATIQSHSKYLVCIGIGGSCLGHRALIEALCPESPTKVLYTGNSLSARSLEQLLDTLDDADFSVNIISKSGTTTEPAVAFRLLKDKLIQKYGDVTAKKRIYATTDAAHGALHDEAIQEGYTRFVVPDNIGGRYSVLSAVGLLPLAVAGVNIDDLLAGAAAERSEYLIDNRLGDTAAVRYASVRSALGKADYDLEVLASFEPSLHSFQEWWKQLFGESEGKQHQGIFPASVSYTTDLHSLGQYMQDGRRNLIETMLEFTTPPEVDFTVPSLAQNLDGLQYIEGKSLNFLNQTALAATVAAHRAGGIPVFEIAAPDFSARSFGALIFFFECACALSALLSGVNPFDQPGVEAYKANMFHLLGKPGF